MHKVLEQFLISKYNSISMILAYLTLIYDLMVTLPGRYTLPSSVVVVVINLTKLSIAVCLAFPAFFQLRSIMSDRRAVLLQSPSANTAIPYYSFLLLFIYW